MCILLVAFLFNQVSLLSFNREKKKKKRNGKERQGNRESNDPDVRELRCFLGAIGVKKKKGIKREGEKKEKAE